MARRKWELRHFVLSGVLAALTFGLAFVLGSGLILATGIPATGGIANIFVAVFILVVGMQMVPRTGFATLTMLIFFSLSIPTLIGGPPGVYKIVIGFLIGIVADLAIAVGRRTKWAYIAAGSLGAITSILSIYAALVLLKLPGAERLSPLVLPLTLLQAVLGAVGGWTAVSFFERRLQHLGSVKQLLDEPSVLGNEPDNAGADRH